eukprot:2863483-Amphidinium_carterae.1
MSETSLWVNSAVALLEWYLKSVHKSSKCKSYEQSPLSHPTLAIVVINILHKGSYSGQGRLQDSALFAV